MQTTERFEKVDVDRLVPYARNARTHSKEQILQLRSSLREFGFVNPVIIDKDYNIIAGHGRVSAAKAEGLTEIPCVFVENLTEAQKKAYILADNRLALSAGWDEELLALEFADLKELGFDLELTGFGADEIEKLFADSGGEVADDDFDLTAALEQAAFVLPGDIWTLGRHRFICGDATDADTVRKLMDGRKANLVLTDPPFNVDFKGSSGLKIKNDSMKTDQFYGFLLSSFTNLADNLEDGGSESVIVENRYVVRRLTPTECALLQGFPPDWCANLGTPEPTEGDIAFWTEVFTTKARIDCKKPKSRNQIIKWLQNPHTDAAEYKLWGNGLCYQGLRATPASQAQRARSGGTRST